MIDLIYQYQYLKINFIKLESEYKKFRHEFKTQYDNLMKNKVYQSDILSTDIETIKESSEEFTKGKPQEGKELFKFVAKYTHPDKVQNEILNKIYIRASNAYESEDISELLYCVISIDSSYDIPNHYLVYLIEDIKLIEAKIDGIKKSHPYKYGMANERDKNKYMYDYIKSELKV